MSVVQDLRGFALQDPRGVKQLSEAASVPPPILLRFLKGHWDLDEEEVDALAETLKLDLVKRPGFENEGDVEPEPVRKCRVCGCTDAEACPGGCTWVDQDLCSQCIPP